MLYALIAAALLYAFINGLNDSAGIVAPVISVHALSPRRALFWVGLGELAGPLLFGVAVARTVGADLLAASVITPWVVLAGVLGAVLWNLTAQALSMPSSSSHALVGGLVGAAVAAGGPAAVQWTGLGKVLLALLLSPLLGFLGGFWFTRLLFGVFANFPPSINQAFRRGQVFTAFAVALAHGSNDAQKAMGVIVLALVSAGRLEGFVVPDWVRWSSAAALALGATVGGWRLIRTLGGRIFRLRPVHGFAAQSAGAGVILSAGLVGGPVSTTQVLSSALMGAGAAERWNKVRWLVARDMLLTWVFTLPTAALAGAVLYWAFTRLPWF